LINHGKLCPSLAAIGSSPVNHCEDWYKLSLTVQPQHFQVSA
jgi:hypothetical protein